MPKFRIKAIKYTSYEYDIDAEDEHEANEYAEDLTEEYCIEMRRECTVRFEAEARRVIDENIHS